MFAGEPTVSSKFAIFNFAGVNPVMHFPMVDDDQQDWVYLYRAALLELDRSLLPQKIETARKAIQQRINELLLESNIPSEHMGLEDALRNLRTLQRETE